MGGAVTKGVSVSDSSYNELPHTRSVSLLCDGRI